MKKKITRAISVALVMLSVMVMCAVGASAATSAPSYTVTNDDMIGSAYYCGHEYSDFLGYTTITITSQVDDDLFPFCEVVFKLQDGNQYYSYRFNLQYTLSPGDTFIFNVKTGAYTVNYTTESGTRETVNVESNTSYWYWYNHLLNMPTCEVEDCGGALSVQHMVPATCDASGRFYFSCVECDGYETDPVSIPSTGHYLIDGSCAHCSYIDNTEHTCDYANTKTYPATCTSVGYTVKVCSVCGQETDTDIVEIPMINHDYKYVSCGAETHIMQCSMCSTTYGSESGHDFKREVISTDSDAGTQTVKYTCYYCNYTTTKTESYTCTSHTWTYDSISETHHQQVCDVCATKGSTSEHTWNAGEVTKQPTIDSNGIRLYRCTLCSTTRTETIDYIDVDAFIASLTESQALQVYEKLFEEYHTYFLNYMDYDARFEKMSDAKAAQIFKQMFFYGSDEDYGKFQQKLTEDLEVGYWFDRYFATEIFPDIAKKGSQSEYYKEFGPIYYHIMKVSPSNSTDYTQGYNDAISSVVDDNPIQGLFQGMWSGVVHFVNVVGNGVSIGGISLISVCTTLVIILLAFLILKVIKK